MKAAGRAKSRPEPAIAKGASNSLPFKVAIIGWIDLLGYGEMIAGVNYNPIAPNAKGPVNRLRAFHRIVAEHSTRLYRTLVLNDGAAAYRDLSLRSQAPTVDFFYRSWKLYEEVQASELRNGYPGARMVVAVGLRAKGSRRAIDHTTGQVGSILRRMHEGQLTAVQAVREAASIQKYFDILPQLQANFAFSKAFVADQSGSKFGLPGPAFYVDDALFDSGKPEWVDAAAPVDWAMPKYKLAARFHPVRAVERPSGLGGSVAGVRDGISIAECIAPSSSVRAAIRVLRASGEPALRSFDNVHLMG